jgi:hypothetical protein
MNRLIVVAASMAIVVACGKKEEAVPTAANAAPSDALEGQVDIIAWPGYVERGATDKA